MTSLLEVPAVRQQVHLLSVENFQLAGCGMPRGSVMREKGARHSWDKFKRQRRIFLVLWIGWPVVGGLIALV